MQSEKWSSNMWGVGLVLSMLFLFGQAVIAADGPADAVHVAGAAVQPSDWSAARIAKDFAADLQTVQFTSHGKPHSAKCVALVTLLKAAGVPTEIKMEPKADPKTKNAQLRLAIVVTGRDGYAAVFSLGELLPNVGHADAWLAVEVDGKPLPDRDGPARLIVPTDKMPVRWVYGVGSITILDASADTKKS